MSEDIWDIEELKIESVEPSSGSAAGTYNDDAIQTLKWNEHIRRRPGMYIGIFL